MKKLLKLFFGFVFGLIALGVVFAMLSDGEPAATTEPGKVAAEKKEQPAVVSVETYDKIVVGDGLTGEGGMTYDEVVALFGSEPSNQNEVQSGDIKMVTAIWQGKGLNFDKMITVIFTNGGASAKTNMGL